MSAQPYTPVPLEFSRYPEAEMAQRGRAFLELVRTRRSVREFAPDPVPRALVEMAIAAAHTAPSGANRQPWHFVAVADPEVKRRIREAAEEEERAFYEGGRATAEWLEDLAPLGTTWEKPFLETAPWLVAVFKEVSGVAPDGGTRNTYYATESVGIACGLFITAVHQMGLATLTHTPQPMRFLGRILGRPANERPFILFPVGYPAPGCTVPELPRKPFAEVATFVGG